MPNSLRGLPGFCLQPTANQDRPTACFPDWQRVAFKTKMLVTTLGFCPEVSPQAVFNFEGSKELKMSTNLIGQDLFASPEVQKHIEALVAEVEAKNSTIQSIRAADPEKTSEMDRIADEINVTRGRPLFYKYVGSGIGRGPYVELIDGSVKLDLINGIGINILGHSHPEIIKASLKGLVE
jgi:hypothetical protein